MPNCLTLIKSQAGVSIYEMTKRLFLRKKQIERMSLAAPTSSQLAPPVTYVSPEVLAKAKEVVNLWESVLDSLNSLSILTTQKHTVKKREQHSTLPWIKLDVSKTVNPVNSLESYGAMGFIDEKDTLEMHASFTKQDLINSGDIDFGLDIILDYFRSHVESEAT